ncbi:Fmp27p SKDI_12G4820 [Saccharomyces kudriavzevii IFO 1802]|uniref:FMP27-like protein n=1 Tax=Saccharomyces kudriavzevii (strain ATCC MYA-4449 / AS 2.2408 / CBS 8840 / NBRC 1802 / NCYC 2889) TaxID=226230 RepID=A0AA35J3A2_SACK1|nr:uncharacterized protein SKDI_12G4820 [Saccharomyces kudriavzevii IFO 1802]CAI4047253.1 hypothetical protein SKDI_12G4820 [Saccharomyces kudriavzevii IFO 1802]
MFEINILLCKWIIIVTTLLWTCKLLIRSIFGVNITWINLFKLQICGVSLEDGSVKLKSIRFAFYEGKLFIKGLQIDFSKYKLRRKSSKNELRKPPKASKSIGSFFTSKIFSFSQCWLNGITIVMEDTRLINNDITIEKFGFFFSIDKSKKNKSLRFDSFLRKLLWNDQVIVADAIFIVTTNLSIGDILNPLKDDLRVGLDLKVGDLKVPMNLVNLLMNKENVDLMSNEKLLQNLKNTVRANHELKIEEITKMKNALMHTMGNFVDQIRPLKELNITVDKLQIKDLPLTSHPELIGMNKYISYNIFISNINFNSIRFRNDMPGYTLIFEEQDSPFKFSIVMARFNIYVNLNRKHQNNTKQLKIIEIPNVSVFGETNLFSQKFFYSNDLQPQQLENAIFNVKGNISSLTIDMDPLNISFIKCFLSNIKVFTSSCPKNKILKENSHIKLLKRRRILFEYFKSFLPLINMKFTLDDPKFVINNEDDLIISKFSVFMISHHSKRYTLGNDLMGEKQQTQQIFYESLWNIELLDMKLQHIIKHQKYEHTILRVDSIAIEKNIRLLPDILCSADADIDTLMLDLSELPTMVMLSELVHNLDDQLTNVEENYFKEFYEKFASNLQNMKTECSNMAKCLRQKDILLSDFVFQQLPDFFDYIKVNIRDISSTLGARSVFMPREVFSSVDSQSSKDLIGGKLRKYCNTIEKFQIAFFGDKTQWHNKIGSNHANMVKSGQLTSFTNNNTQSFDHKSSIADLDDISTSDATEVNHFWNINLLINDITTSIIGETPELSEELSKKTVSKVSNLVIKLYPDSDSFSGIEKDSKIILQINHSRGTSVVSLMSIFLAVSGIHTLNQIFGRCMSQKMHQSKTKQYFIALSESKKKSCLKSIKWSQLKELIEINFSSEYMSQIVALPNGLRTKFEPTSTFATLKNCNEISISGQYFRMMVESPTKPNFWERMACIDRFKVIIQIDLMKQQMEKLDSLQDWEELKSAITLENESWHFSIPHQFEMFKIIDSIPTIFKSIKQMLYSLNTSKNDLIIFPHKVETPLSLPKIKLKSKRWLFSISDDPLEAELNTIFQIGLQEQRERLAKLQEFNKRISEDLIKNQKNVKEVKDDFKAIDNVILKHRTGLWTKNGMGVLRKSATDPEIPLTPRPFNTNGRGNFKAEMPQFISPEIEKAYNTVLENFSDSWIRRVKEYKVKERREFERNFSFLWGFIDYSKLPKDINRKVLPFATNPFLMNLIIENIDIDIIKPFCGIKNIPNFIYNVGKGVPKDTEYSIMIPMHLDAKFSEVRWHLRDYPLPFVCIPPLSSTQSKETISTRIYGDFMITEDILQSEKELRTLFVPLIPSVTVENTDKYYSLLVPRTMTSAKIFTDLNFEINSKHTTRVTWGGSYQPAIQQTMQCLDNFSKPPLDPSVKLGFWDKTRYLFHGKINILWKRRGKFEISLKGAKSPYMLGGESAGFIVGFDGDVNLRCNEDSDPKKFLSCSADKVHFSIPNYFARPLLVWSRPSTNTMFIPNQDDTNLQRYASFYYLLNITSSKNEKADKEIMKKSFIEKTGIKLSGGMTLDMGIIFERLGPSLSERTFESKKHYLTRLCNPIYVRNLSKHDSYAGFRSDFIHMSFGLSSNSNSAYNAMQLSPNGFKAFFIWWKSFSGNFPVRRGPLFGLQSISPKFGEHLYTISYHADVSPLFINYMYHNADADQILRKNYSKIAEFIGLKAKASHFVMDLHQRKEVLTEYQAGLNIRRRVMKLKFLAGDVVCQDVDVRTASGEFTKLNYIEEKEDAEYDIFDNDMSWLDITDFQDAFFINPENYVPRIKIMPFGFSPQFAYQKRASYADKYQVDPQTCKPITPFDNRVSHNCTLGHNVSLRADLVEKRVTILKNFKEKLEKNIEENRTAGMSDENLKDLLSKANFSVKNAELLLEDFETIFEKQGSEQTEKPFHFESLNLLKATKKTMKQFENRFFIFNVLLKWNEDARSAVLKFLYHANLTSEFASLASGRGLREFEDTIKQREMTEETTSLDAIPEGEDNGNIGRQFHSCDDTEFTTENLLKMFEKNITELTCDIKSKIHHKFFVQFITPQIQLTSLENPETCVLVSSPFFMFKTLEFDANTTSNTYMQDIFLKRYGILFGNANAFLFNKRDYEEFFELYFGSSSYGQHKDEQWPPWLGLELGFEPSALEKKAVVKNISALLQHQKLSQVSARYDSLKDKIEDKICGYVPQVNVELNSQEYLMLTKMVMKLFLYIEPEDEELKKYIEKLIIGYDIYDTVQTRKLVNDLHNSEQILAVVEKELLFKRSLLDDVGKLDLFNLHNERMHQLLRLYILMKIFTSNGNNHVNRTLLWNIKVNETLLHLLEENGKPFLDVAVAKLNFNRVQHAMGLRKNTVTVKLMQIFDLKENINYHCLLGPLTPNADNAVTSTNDMPLVQISWDVDKPVGGIKIIKNVETTLSGLTVKLEEDRLNKIFEWLSLKELMSDENGNDDDGASSIFDMISSESEEGKIEFSEDISPDFNEMLKRSSDYMIVEDLKLNSFKLCISYKGRGKMRLANVTNFVFNFPTLRLANQTLRVTDLLLALKKVLIKVLIKHTGRFISNKLRRNSKANKMTDDTKPLKQLTTYKSFTEPEELR